MTEQLSKKERLNNLYAQFNDLLSIALDTSGASRIVFGYGDPEARLMIIGEAPGRQEDISGTPFIGRSGKLLTKTLEKFGLSRESVFITNTVKCRPPGNRTPTPQEIDYYKKLFLDPEIKIVQPKVILVVGAVALKALLPESGPISKIRGKLFSKNGIIVIPTFHPAYILRNSKMLPLFEQDILLAICTSNN